MAGVSLATMPNDPDRPLKRPNAPNLGKVTPQQRDALDRMVWEGIAWDKAAKDAQINLHQFRTLLGKPATLQYLRAQRQVLRASLSTANIHRLAQIRDAADNMPAVNAIKLLEDMGEDDPKAGDKAITPGITIQINTSSPRAPQVTDNTVIIDADKQS